MDGELSEPAPAPDGQVALFAEPDEWDHHAGRPITDVHLPETGD